MREAPKTLEISAKPELVRWKILYVNAGIIVEYLHQLSATGPLSFRDRALKPIPADTRLVASSKRFNRWDQVELILESEEFELVDPNQLPEIEFVVERTQL